MKKSDVIEYFGSAAKTARALRISPSAVTRWEDDIPDSSAYKVEILSGGKLKTDETLRISIAIAESGNVEY